MALSRSLLFRSFPRSFRNYAVYQPLLLLHSFPRLRFCFFLFFFFKPPLFYFWIPCPHILSSTPFPYFPVSVISPPVPPIHRPASAKPCFLFPKLGHYFFFPEIKPRFLSTALNTHLSRFSSFTFLRCNILRKH